MNAWLWTLPVLLVLAIPWLVTLIAAGVQVAVHARLTRTPGGLARSAERWLRVAARGLSTRVEVHSALPEAYYPHVDTVGLPPSTARSHHPVHRAMAAHELGHARLAGRHPLIRAALPAARLACQACPYATAAIFVVLSLGQATWMAPLAIAAIAATALSFVVVLADEALASRFAATAIAADPELTASDRRVARGALLAALLAYAAPAVAWVALLGGTPLLLDLALNGHPLPPAEPLDATGTWLILFFGPFLLLQAGLVLAETVRPEPVRSAFALELRQERIEVWGFVGGSCALLIAFGVAGWSDSPAFRIALALAIFTGLQPLTILIRATAAVPLLLLARALGLEPAIARAFAPRPVRELHAPGALAALFERPGLVLRAARLAQLAWAPLLVGALSSPWWR